MKRRRFVIALADGAYGPGDVEPFLVTEVRVLRGLELPNWKRDSILASCEEAFLWRGELVACVTLDPRYETDSLSSIQSSGGVVAVGRVLPSHDALQWTQVDTSAMHYWGVGVAKLVDTQTESVRYDA